MVTTGWFKSQKHSACRPGLCHKVLTKAQGSLGASAASFSEQFRHNDTFLCEARGICSPWSKSLDIFFWNTCCFILDSFQGRDFLLPENTGQQGLGCHPALPPTPCSLQVLYQVMLHPSSEKRARLQSQVRHEN